MAFFFLWLASSALCYQTAKIIYSVINHRSTVVAILGAMLSSLLCASSFIISVLSLSEVFRLINN